MYVVYLPKRWLSTEVKNTSLDIVTIDYSTILLRMHTLQGKSDLELDCVDLFSQIESAMISNTIT